MPRQLRDNVTGGFGALDGSPAATTRRGMLGKVGALAVGVTPYIAGSTGLDAKRKRSKKKNKKRQERPAKISDWLGNWTTRLDNGVRGTASFLFNSNLGRIEGAYSNTVSTGEFVCVLPATGTSLSCSYDQVDGQTGTFQIDLKDKDHWNGDYQIDGGDEGTWSGVRQ